MPKHVYSTVVLIGSQVDNVLNKIIYKYANVELKLNRQKKQLKLQNGDLVSGSGDNTIKI
jgi:hypothetical protein